MKVSLLTFVPAFNREKTKRMAKETLTDREVLLLRRKLDLLLRTGKLLMESAADTNRIERNMKRVAAFMGIPEEKLHLDIRWTMIMVNVSDETHSFSKFQKCEKHGINMTTITEVSHCLLYTSSGGSWIYLILCMEPTIRRLSESMARSCNIR